MPCSLSPLTLADVYKRQASVPFLSIAQYGVLEAVYQITLDGRLAGRGNPSKLLQKRGMQLSEYRVRKCLRELVELGLLLSLIHI